MFARALRERVRSGEITSSVRIWHRPRVKSGNLYRMEDGHVRVTSVHEIAPTDVTDAMARASGFEDVAELMATARHGAGENVYLIQFEFIAPARDH